MITNPSSTKTTVTSQQQSMLRLDFILGCIRYIVSQYPYSLPNMKKTMISPHPELNNKFPVPGATTLRDLKKDFVSKTDVCGSLGPSKDINALTLESDAPSLKRKIDFGDSVTPRKRRILESYSTGDMCQVVAVYSDITCQVDVQLGPFGIKCVTLYEPYNTKTFIWSLPAEILIATVALLGAQDLHSVTQVSSLLREIAAPLFFVQRDFPTSPKNLFHIRVDSPNFDVLSTWRWMDNFCLPESIPHKSIKYITLFWNFDILTSPVLSQMVALLENICASGVEELTCMGFCDGAVSLSITGLTRIQACIVRHPACVGHCDSIGYLLLSLPNSHSSAAMMCWSGTRSMVCIKHLAIDCSDGSASATGATSDSLALSAAWIQALPQVKCVTLQGYSATAAGDLVDIMRSFALGDVELAVDLQVSPDGPGGKLFPMEADRWAEVVGYYADGCIKVDVYEIDG
ncbi:uncharacterized protein HD556DRAFT_1306600 [Suillus plorans]|uniref:F-box domain-containing protein n=1 Tax=Suillus plorans TaxID=116603 RepID=A0A9P7DL25_9AGAM|nr:uncharacterized protein HD556DRAFT_1306600 [Suillus plorans]KAG1797462.1 hypothetical protein HD556DRAFT_1306600 [Suillus plorans]